MRTEEPVAPTPQRAIHTRVAAMYEVTTAELTPAELQRHIVALTMTPRDPYQRGDASFKAYVQKDGKLYVPRWYGLRQFGAATIDATDDGKPLSAEACAFGGALHATQVEAMMPVLAALQHSEAPSPRGGMLSLPCGYGKTICALYALAHVGRRALILCHKTFLIDQWCERIGAFLPGARVAVIKQAQTGAPDADVVVASLQSIALRSYDEHVLSGFGLLVIDEAHHLSAPCLSRALQRLPMRRVLALSATPERRDGLTHLLFDSMGPMLFRTERANERVLVTRLRYVNRSNQMEILGRDGKPVYSRMVNRLADDTLRTAVVAQHLVRLMRTGRQIIVLSDRIQLLESTAKAVVALGADAACLALYIGRCTPAERESAATKQVVLSTFSLAREGLDLARLDTLVLLTPSSSVEQATGRILRPDPDGTKKTPLVLDIVDEFSIFSHMAQKRQRYYRGKKYEVQDVPMLDWDVGDPRIFP